MSIIEIKVTLQDIEPAVTRTRCLLISGWTGCT